VTLGLVLLTPWAGYGCQQAKWTLVVLLDEQHGDGDVLNLHGFDEFTVSLPEGGVLPSAWPQ